jgi:hypothetical protein
VSLGGEVHDGVNLVAFHAFKDVGGVGDIATVEGEVLVTIETSCIVQSGAVIQFVEGNDVICWVCEDKMADQPTCSDTSSAKATQNITKNITERGTLT